MFQGGDSSEPRNYRYISLLPVVSKLLERIAFEQLQHYIATRSDLGILPIQQFACRRGHSCEDALTVVIDYWMSSLDKGQSCGALSMDMRKAFDRVQRHTLIDDLSACGIRGTALNWFISYLSGRQQFASLPGVHGLSTTCSCGVPQGSVLGPFLFTVYLRLVPSVFEHSTVLC